MARAYGEAGQWTEMVTELTKAAEGLAGKEKIAVQIECMDFLAERVGDAGHAETLCREILRDEPRQPIAAAAFESLLFAQERWPELLALLHEEVAAASEPARK